MSRRYRISAVLNVESQIRRELDIANVEGDFESNLDALIRNKSLIKLLQTGNETHRNLANSLAACDHGSGKPCRLTICHVCSRENRRLFVADGLKALDLMPDSSPSTSSHLFVTLIDHHWIRRWSMFDEFDMSENAQSLIQMLQGSDLAIERFIGAWDFEWRRWELNDEPPKEQKFWVPHVHAVVKTSLSLSEFKARLRPKLQRKVIVSVERPTMVRLIDNPFGALSYVRKQIFGQRNLTELRPESRHQNPSNLGPKKLMQLCTKLHEQGYKSRLILIGCRLRRGRIKKTD